MLSLPREMSVWRGLFKVRPKAKSNLRLQSLIILWGIWFQPILNPGSLAQAPVQDFVRRFYMEGIPYEEAIRYDSTAVPILLSMLRDSTEEAYWPNIVVTLGIVGSDRVADSLIAFLARDVPQEFTRSQYQAKTSVLFALGYLANRTGSPRALEFLAQNVDERAWALRGRAWANRYHATRAERDRQLAALAVVALGLSARPTARITLDSLDTVAHAWLRPAVREAIRTHEVIRRDGLISYYRRIPPSRGRRP
jgi:hypothetical protein